jgi:uncharacterized membrane protein
MKKEPQKLSLNEKLDMLLKNQKKILSNEKKILGEEYKIEELEDKELQNEDKFFHSEEDALKELATIEKQLKKGFSNPISKITKRDIFKGFIGAFIGILGHFAFMKALDLSHKVSYYRTTLFYVIAFIIIVIMLYYTGFKKVKKHIILKFMPLRALILYVVSIFAIIFINLVFGNIHYPISFGEVYKIVGASIILAVIGAGTADLIGNIE